MARLQPNAQLEAALAQFGQQAEVSPNQGAQLRAAITVDTKLLAELNAAALANQLRGFALAAADGGVPNHVGHYDLQSGVVSLSPAAFQPSGALPGDDLRAVLQVQEMTIRFGHSTYTVPTLPGAGAPVAPQPVSQDMLENLQATLNGSQLLAEEVKRAATTRDTSRNASGMLLENFGFVRAGVSAGGTYDGGRHTLNLPPAGLQTRTVADPNGRFDPDDLTFVIGHEVQHAFNHPAKNQATALFIRQIEQVAASPAIVHDYTATVRDYIQAGRNDEAKAEIAGWNALLSRQERLDPGIGLEGMRLLPSHAGRGRTQDFVELDNTTNATVPRSGVAFNSDNTLSQTPANIAAMGQHYFNRPDASAPPGQRPVHLGESGKTDYINYYGTWAVEKITEAERRHLQSHPGVVHRLTLNMASIGLKESLMEQEGINITINKSVPQPYYDSSQTPATSGNFHHTRDGTVDPRHDHQYVPVAPAKDDPQTGAGPSLQLPNDLRDPTHPAHAMYRQNLGEVYRMEDGQRIQHGPHSEKLAAALSVAAERERMQITNVEMGRDGNIDGVMRGRASAPERCVSVNPGEALAGTMEDYAVQWAQARSRHYVSGAPADERTHEQVQAYESLSSGDKRIFDKIRSGTPPHISDDVVATALFAAKKDGMTDVSSIGSIQMMDDRLAVLGACAGYRAITDVSQKHPPMQETTGHVQALNQQQALTQQEERLSQQRTSDASIRGL